MGFVTFLFAFEFQAMLQVLNMWLWINHVEGYMSCFIHGIKPANSLFIRLLKSQECFNTEAAHLLVCKGKQTTGQNNGLQRIGPQQYFEVKKCFSLQPQPPFFP